LKTKTLINAVMMLALYLVFLILFNLGIFSIATMVMMPLPIIIFSVMSKKTSETLMLFIGCLLGAYLVASIFGIFATLIFGLMGLVIGISIVKERPYWQRLFNGALVYVIGLPLLVFFISGMNLAETLSEMFQESLDMVSTLMPTADTTLLATSFNTVLTQALPTMLLLAGLFMAFLSDKLAVFIIRRLKISDIVSPKWENFQLGILLAILYMVGQLLYGRLPNPALNVVVVNIVLLLNLLFAVQGFVIVRLFFQSRLKDRLGLIVAVVMLISGLTMILSMIGVMDAAFNYRKRFFARTGL